MQKLKRISLILCVFGFVRDVRPSEPFVMEGRQDHMDEGNWNPVQLIEPDRHNGFNYAVLLLNTEIKVPANVIRSLWQNAKFRVLVDGGANRWLSFLQNHPDGQDMADPDLLSGDFDSVSNETLNIFRKTNAIIKPTPDQDETDFTKALRLLKPFAEEKNITSVVVIQENGDRFDQVMANINTLFKAAKFLPNIRVYLLGGSSLTWLLKPGQHFIQVPSYLVESNVWCGLIPVGQKSTVTTKGLKWNLDNGVLNFGELISTSNTYEAKSVEITTNTFLLWSMGVFNLDAK